jgi:haloacetate dehalogenase
VAALVTPFRHTRHAVRGARYLVGRCGHGAGPDALLDHVFATWPTDPAAIGADHRAAYRRAMTAGTIAAMCADYRASFHLDRRHDADDRAAGRRIAVPVLVVVGRDETQLADADAVWRAWAADLAVVRVAGGHFVPEEAPDELTAALAGFLATDDAGPA